MIIGERLRELREAKHLTQRDVEHKTALQRCYVSRVENGYTVPTLETLEKFARALEIPLYQLFYDGEEPTKLPNSLKGRLSDDTRWGSSGKKASYLHKLRKCLAKTEEPDRKIVLLLAKKMVASKHAKLLGPRY
jgi:transcriptional regulator with XRE-family HTH domain